jgi:hypothetical protein
MEGMMEEERREDSTEQNGEEEAGSFRESDDIAEEIQQLVEAMARAARNVWSSEQRLQLEDDLRRGLGSLVGSLEEALDRFRRSEQGQEFQEKASKAADRFRESALTPEMKDGLTVGLKAAANEFRKFADSLEEQQEGSDSVQDIPVEGEDDENGEGQA